MNPENNKTIEPFGTKVGEKTSSLFMALRRKVKAPKHGAFRGYKKYNKLEKVIEEVEKLLEKEKEIYKELDKANAQKAENYKFRLSESIEKTKALEKYKKGLERKTEKYDRRKIKSKTKKEWLLKKGLKLAKNLSSAINKATQKTKAAIANFGIMPNIIEVDSNANFDYLHCTSTMKTADLRRLRNAMYNVKKIEDNELEIEDNEKELKKMKDIYNTRKKKEEELIIKKIKEEEKYYKDAEKVGSKFLDEHYTGENAKEATRLKKEKENIEERKITNAELLDKILEIIEAQEKQEAKSQEIEDRLIRTTAGISNINWDIRILKETTNGLEDTNKKIKSTVAETLKDISQAIRVNTTPTIGNISKVGNEALKETVFGVQQPENVNCDPVSNTSRPTRI